MDCGDGFYAVSALEYFTVGKSYGLFPKELNVDFLGSCGSREGGGEEEKGMRRRDKEVGRRRGGGRRGEKKEWRRETTQLQQGEQTKIDPVFQVEGGWRKHWQRMGLYTEMASSEAFPVELPAVKILKYMYNIMPQGVRLHTCTGVSSPCLSTM